MRIESIELPTPALDGLRREAAAEGHAFLERLQIEWERGANRFDRPGECLLGALAGGRLVGIGGLNRDPFRSDPRVGRLRHLYVAGDFRRRGIGALIVDRLLGAARGRFDLVRLRTDNAAAAAFYVVRGFSRVNAREATHQIVVEQKPGLRR